MKGLVGKRWWSMLLLLGAGILLYKFLGNLGGLWRAVGQLIDILSPFIGGFVLAFLLYQPQHALENVLLRSRMKFFNRTARVWSIVAVYLGLLVVFSLMVSVIVPVLVEAVSGIIKSMPSYYDTIMNFLNGYDQQEGLFALLNIPEVLQGVYNFILERLTVENILSYLSGLVSLTSSFVSVVIAFIISIYMLSGREALLHTVRRVADAFLPARAVRLSAHYSRKTGEIFTRYVYSMLLDALCVCILLIPGLYISGISYPLAFAVFIGVANLIPYFGAIISGASAVVVLLLGGHWGMALFLAIYIVVIQQLDGNLLQPRIYGQSVGMKPIYVLLAITVGGGVGGFVGMLIGVPVTAVVKILVSDLITYRNRKKNTQEPVVE